jgi:hypothetical protein
LAGVVRLVFTMRIVLAAALLSACAGQLANPLDSEEIVDAPVEERAIGPAHGVEREHVEYEVKLRGILVGRVQVAVGSRGVVDGRPAVVVRSRAAGAGVAEAFGYFNWELTTTVDIDGGCAVEEDEEVTMSFAGKREHEHRTRKFTLEECHHNVHTGAGALRGWRSRIGSTAQLEVSFDGGSVDIGLTDAARETIGTVQGSTPAIRYDGMLRGKHSISAWLSDDDARVPLRMHSGSKVGDIDVEMVSYEVPREQ